MQITGRTIFSATLLSIIAFGAASKTEAQITNQVDATISHSFIAGAKTLPPGKYVFEMSSGGAFMKVTSADGKDSDMFAVRESQAPKTPAHTELVFRRYGETEFLSKIYEGGNKIGVAVSEPSKQEKQLKAQGQQATEHSEAGGGGG